ncbi:MAG: cadherin repeat domain-containing protein [Phycisphaera sp. RhM]|nr:cadherin repeat domain-containing protein [Phycisphaera sp. RhM]
MRQHNKGFFSRLASRRWSAKHSANRSRKQFGRRSRLETLESRRVLAATIASFSPTPSGFVAELSEEINTSVINLYDSENGLAGAADVTLTGATTGDVAGSLIMDGTSLTFIASGGPLATDTYTVTLRSATDGFKDLADGELLDGDGDSVAGGNFVDTFTVSSGTALVVSLPDFVRGPTQAIQVPAAGSGQDLPPGLPIQLSDAEGVTSLTLTIEYDPTLLDISGVQLGSDAPANSQVDVNLTVPGVATISFFSLAPLAAGAADLVDIIATVPEDAPYGTSQSVRMTSIEVNAGAIDAAADDALHVVAFPGDVNQNRRYDAEDARLIARVGVDLDSGFVFSNPTGTTASTRLFPNIDPVLLGDVSGVDGVSPLDASDVLRRVVGLSTPNIPDLPDAQAPTGISLSSDSIDDSTAVGTTVGSFTTSDPDSGDTHTYTLVSGTGDTDNASFSITGNALVTAQTFDASAQNSVSIRVRSTDSTGRFVERVITLTVEHANAAPTALAISSMTVDENVSSGTAVGTFTTTDADSGDTHTYSIVSIDASTTSTAFTISGNSLLVATALDFETKSSYSVVVRSTDAGGLSVDQTFTITVSDVNETPTALTLSNSTVGADAAVGTTVGTLSTTDVDSGETFTYSLVSGTGDDDNASFSITGDELQTAATLDFSSQSSYSVRVRTTDAGGETVEQVFTITQGDSAPSEVTLSSDTVAENSATATVVGDLQTTDSNPNDTHTYAFVSGDGDDDNASFTISGGQLLTAESFDFESQDSYTIRVRSTDSSGLSVEQVLVISVTNVNESASAVSLSHSSVADGQPSGTVVGTLSSDDPDSGDTLTYTLVSGTGDDDNASFTISGDELVTGFAADQSTKSSYSIRVQVTDADGLSIENTFTIDVTSENVAPTAVALSNSSIAEDVAVDSAVGTLTTTDANSSDVFVYTLVSGTGDADNASFAIDGDTLTLNTTLDFESQSSYSVRIRSTDPFGLFVEEVFTISVSDVNEAPDALTLDSTEINDGDPSGTSVGTFSVTDPDSGDSVTFSLVAGEGDTDNASFTISNAELVTAFDADFFQQGTYSVRVRATDAGGLVVEQAFTISVTEPNAAPTAISISQSTVAENVAVGTSVGTLTTTDANSNDTHSYDLVAGDGDSDNASFAIVDGVVQTATELDFETQSTYSIRVRTTDNSGESFEQAFSISVSDVNEAPENLSLSFSSVADEQPADTVIGDLFADDPDSGDTLTLSLVSGDGDADNADFTIENNRLVITEAVDDAIQSLYSVRVRAEDSQGLFTEHVFSIDVTEANVAPSAVVLSNSTLNDGDPSGTVVGTLTATDSNSTDVHSFSLVAGSGDTDNASFTIDGDQLKSAVPIDSGSPSSFSIRVLAQDRYGLTVEQVLTITVQSS